MIRRLEFAINFLILCLLLFIGWRLTAGSARTAKAEPPLPKAPVSLEDAVTRGNPAAAVAIVEFSDFQCPFCKAFVRDTLPTLDKDYVETGKVLFAFRHFPLEGIHQFAFAAAATATCAGRQAKFWEMHDLLFADHAQLDESSLGQLARTLNLNPTDYATCVSGPAAASIRRDEATGKDLSVAGTPTFFIGTIGSDRKVRVTDRLSGAMPIAEFRKAIDPLLSAATTARR